MRLSSFVAWLRVFTVTLALFWSAGIGAVLAEHNAPKPLTQFDLIGYSDNGRYLAYETYGYQDDPALAYAHVQVLDLRERRWVIGSPIVSDAVSPEETIADMRQKVREKAEFLLQDLHVIRPAFLAALIGDGALEQTGDALDFGVPQADGGAPLVPFTLTMTQFDVQAAAPCSTLMDEMPQGFRLSMSSFDRKSSIYEDGALTRSRGCPTDYQIKAVVLPYRAENLTHAMALIAADNYGQDGVYRSFVPVPLGLPGGGIN